MVQVFNDEMLMFSLYTWLTVCIEDLHLQCCRSNYRAPDWHLEVVSLAFVHNVFYCDAHNMILCYYSPVDSQWTLLYISTFSSIVGFWLVTLLHPIERKKEFYYVGLKINYIIFVQSIILNNVTPISFLFWLLPTHLIICMSYIHSK